MWIPGRLLKMLYIDHIKRKSFTHLYISSKTYMMRISSASKHFRLLLFNLDPTRLCKTLRFSDSTKIKDRCVLLNGFFRLQSKRNIQQQKMMYYRCH